MTWSEGERVRLRRGGALWRIEKVRSDGTVDLRNVSPGKVRTCYGIDPSRLLPVPKKGPRVPDRQRFLAHLAFDGDCVVWKSSLTTSGYAQFTVEGRKRYAHRWFWEHEIGPVPAGMELDHLCRNRACVNLTHLEPVTPRENVRRGTSPIADGMRQTHCVNGHPFAGENLLIRNNGQRACRICCRENARRKRSRAKELREPTARIKALSADTRMDHKWDGV